MRPWILWLSLLLLAVTVGWFWMLSRDLTFKRVDQSEIKPPQEQKAEPAKVK